MKVLINYDLIDSVKNVNEPFTPFKLIRNSKKRWVKINLPIYAAIDLTINEPSVLLPLLGFQFLFITNLEYFSFKAIGYDPFREKSELNLRNLAVELQDFNVDTDYEQILKSEEIERVYNLRLNNHKLPVLVESKYILVPTYTFNRGTKDTYFFQEHVVGSNSYVLSLGSPKKKLKVAYANT